MNKLEQRGINYGGGEQREQVRPDNHRKPDLYANWRDEVSNVSAGQFFIDDRSNDIDGGVLEQIDGIRASSRPL